MTERSASTWSESRWAAELKALGAAAVAILVLVAALIAEALWGNGVMAAIILTAIAVALVVHYAPRLTGRHPRTH
jgi:hypothetical protein